MPMNRIFLGLAVTSGTLLVASFAVGLAAGGIQGPSHVWHDIHFLLGLLTVLVASLAHSIVFTYFLGTGRWVKEVVRVYRLPDWIYGQAIKNKRRAFPFELLSMAFLAFTAWLGAGTDARGWPSIWHLGCAAFTLAFNAGAFVAEYAAIVAQARLILEVKAEADRLRQAQNSPEHVASASSSSEDQGSNQGRS
jgi:hypothetical protein